MSPVRSLREGGRAPARAVRRLEREGRRSASLLDPSLPAALWTPRGTLEGPAAAGPLARALLAPVDGGSPASGAEMDLPPDGSTSPRAAPTGGKPARATGIDPAERAVRKKRMRVENRTVRVDPLAPDPPGKEKAKSGRASSAGRLGGQEPEAGGPTRSILGKKTGSRKDPAPGVKAAPSGRPSPRGQGGVDRELVGPRQGRTRRKPLSTRPSVTRPGQRAKEGANPGKLSETGNGLALKKLLAGPTSGGGETTPKGMAGAEVAVTKMPPAPKKGPPELRGIAAREAPSLRNSPGDGRSGDGHRPCGDGVPSRDAARLARILDRLESHGPSTALPHRDPEEDDRLAFTSPLPHPTDIATDGSRPGGLRGLAALGDPLPELARAAAAGARTGEAVETTPRAGELVEASLPDALAGDEEDAALETRLARVLEDQARRHGVPVEVP